MKHTLKGWLVDNTITTDNKADKILLLESADNQSVDKMCVNKQVEIKEI